MKKEPKKPPSRHRRPTNLTLDPIVIAAARAYTGVGRKYKDLSALVEEAIREKIGYTPLAVAEPPAPFGQQQPAPKAPPSQRPPKPKQTG